VKCLEKHKLLIFPLILGLVLMIYSWFLSYPLLINSVDDYVFNHLSIIYWFSLVITLASMFMIAATSKNNTLKWAMTVAIIATMFSLSYFYPSPPTSDANLFRGLNENFANAKSLDVTSYRQSYFQWPSVFILTYVATAISGLNLVIFEFLMYGLIGFLLVTTLYVYLSGSFRHGAFIAVVAFFIVNSGYVNYQFAPYTIALCLLFLLFILDTKRPSSSITLTMLLLFVAITLTHAFVPLFFAIFLLMKWIVTRSKRYITLFLFAAATYFVYQFTSASFSFANNIIRMLTVESELSRVISIVPWSHPIDAIAQQFTAPTTVICAIVCFVGFVYLLTKRKLRTQDKAIFLLGIFYLGLGVAFYALGSRGIAIAFIPISLGAAYLYESKFRKFSKVLFLILLILFMFTPMRLTFFKTGLFFQTNQGYEAANFLVDNYNWNEHSLIVADYRTTQYLASRVTGNADFNTVPDPSQFKYADTIFYDVGLGINMDYYFNRTIEDTLDEDMLNVLYDNGYSLVITQDKP
jgi:hypothetical protein